MRPHGDLDLVVDEAGFFVDEALDGVDVIEDGLEAHRSVAPFGLVPSPAPTYRNSGRCVVFGNSQSGLRRSGRRPAASRPSPRRRLSAPRRLWAYSRGEEAPGWGLGKPAEPVSPDSTHEFCRRAFFQHGHTGDLTLALWVRDTCGGGFEVG